MRKANRYRLNGLANAIEEASERLVTWLRAKAERKMRPRPLRFENASEKMMREMMDASMRAMLPSIIKNITSEPRIVRISRDDRRFNDQSNAAVDWSR